MEIALIADLHGNWPAIQAVEQDIRARGIREIYCLGDMVGKGPGSKTALDWTAEHCKLILAGNWDLFVLENDSPACRYVLNQLTPDDVFFIQKLPLEHAFWFSGRHIRLLHGRPTMPLISPFAPEDELSEYFNGADAAYSVMGYADVHQPGFRILTGDRYIFNTGSVGNAINDTRAHYAILSGEMGERPAPFSVTMVSVEYDRGRSIRDALLSPDMPLREAYIREIETGIYSRVIK